MTNKRNTKSALFTSFISLLLCCSMLIGTTFAWFTDSVTSANNIIKSGNLDVELEYWDGDSWEDVSGKSDILTNTLWEPGVTEIAYLRVANAGSLALKYQLGINIVNEIGGTNVAGEAFKLSDYIQFGVVENINGETGAYTTRDAAVAAVTGAKKISAGFTKASKIEAGADDHYFALVVYMPTTVTNVANHKTGTAAPQIDLGINVFATQLNAETDSFGPDYDESSPMKPAESWDGTIDENIDDAKDVTEQILTITTAEQLAALAAEVNAGNSYAGWTVKLAANIDLLNMPWTPIGQDLANCFSGTFDGAGYTIYNLNVTAVNSAGLIGYAAYGGNVKNLTVENATVSANDYAGAIMGRGYTTIVNCHVKNANVTVTPYLTSDGETYDGGAKAGAVVGQLLEGAGNGVDGCTATNVYIKGYRDLGGVVGMIHNDNFASNCSAENVTIEYISITGAYDSNTPNENAGAVYGRKQSSATIAGISDEANSDFTLVVAYVSSDAELTAALNTIKSNASFQSREVTIFMASGTYSADHVINQYPEWNGNVGAGGSANNYGYGVPSGAPITEIVFEGQDGTVFTGNVTINGFGNAGTGFSTATATTTFRNITFNGANSLEANGEDYAVVYVSAAANNITFDSCTFENATHVLLGTESGANGVGLINVNNCEFNDGGCLSGYFETLNVNNTNVTAAKNGFINKSKAGNITVNGGTMNVGKYFLRTGNSGVNMTVNDATISLYESEGAADLVKFRGSAESATFTGCNLPATYTTAGVDADSILTIN